MTRGATRARRAARGAGPALLALALALGGGCTTGGDPNSGPTFGQPCASDGDCTGPGERCSNHAFASGTIYPQAVCVAPCTVQDPTMLQPCAVQPSGRFLGYCVGAPASQAGWCLPACEFDATTYTVACAGQNACQVRGIGRDTGVDAGVLDAAARIDAGSPVAATSPTVYGIGVCWGGCKTDADCTQNDRCQVETGECLHTTVAYAKPVGAPCDVTMDQGACNCLGTAAQLAYCSRVCTTGGYDCMSGYTCSAELPSTTGTVRFAGQPAGIQGHCLRGCTPTPVDAGVVDAGSHDAGALDASAVDAGAVDASVVDAPAVDVPDAGPPHVAPVVPCPNASVCGSTAGVANVCVPASGM